MRRAFVAVLMILSAGVCGVRAQTGRATGESAGANPISTEHKQYYNRIRDYLLRTAQMMPEEHYSYKMAPGAPSFGQILGHVADSQAWTCSAVHGPAVPGVDGGSKTSKSDLVAALKESSAICDAAFASLNDATIGQIVRRDNFGSTRRGSREYTKLGALTWNTWHDTEEYGILSAYLVLKGLSPPGGSFTD